MTVLKKMLTECVLGSRSPLNPERDSSNSSIEAPTETSPLQNMDQESGSNRKLKQEASSTLYLAAISALLGAIGMGAVLGWTAPAFDSMRDPNSTPHLLDSESDKSAKTWIGSSMTIGALVGALISGPMAQFFGRKKALIMYSVPYTIGWLTLAFSNSVALLIVGRVIVGVSAGLLSGTAPSYLIEISIINIRGILGASFQLCITIGILLVYVFGAFLTWNILAGLAAIPTILMGIFMFFMPETPSWLVSHNKISEAKEAFKSLRGPKNDTEQELNALQDQNKSSQQSEGFSLGSYLQREHALPLLLAIGLMFFQQFSGINAVMFYATNIFIESGSSITPKIATIVVGVAQVFATVLGTFLVDRLGRKMLLCISGALHVISTGMLGFYYYYTQNDTTNSYGWVPLVSLVIFIIGFSTGWGPIPWLMVAEITPTLSRSATSAVATAFNWTCAFLITKNFEFLKDAITKHGTFFLFSLISLLSIIFTLFSLPETKGKSAEEIQLHFSSASTQQGLLKNGNNQTTSDKVELQKLHS